MMVNYLNTYGFNFEFKKLGGGYYMFGTKKIFAKIQNGKLIIRVGGGWMGADEFFKQYGQQEHDKAMLMRGEGGSSAKGMTPASKRTEGPKTRISDNVDFNSLVSKVEEGKPGSTVTISSAKKAVEQKGGKTPAAAKKK